MNNLIRKIDNLRHRVSGILAWFPRELYASYLIPALFLLCVGAAVVAMDWLYISSERGFTENYPSPRTYRALSPMSYFDIAATDRLRGIVGDSVAGVVVRNVGAAERMRLRLEEFRRASMENDMPRALAERFPEGLFNAFNSMPGEQRELLLSATARIGEEFFETAASGYFAVELEDRSILWAEINRLEIPLIERNLVYQLLEEILEPRYYTDMRLTALARAAERRDIPVIERRMEVGDVIVRQGEVITPSIARLLIAQGYPVNQFPLVQLILACIFALLLPLWMNIVTYRGTHARRLDDVTWGCVVFAAAVGWLCKAAAVRLGIDGGGVLAAVTVSFLCMPPRLAFHVALAGTISGVFLTTGLPMYGAFSFVLLAFTAAISGFYAMPKIDSLKSLRSRVFFMAVFLAVVKEATRGVFGLPLLESLAVSWPIGDTWVRAGHFLLFDLTTTFLAVSFLLTVENSIGAFSAIKAKELSQPSTPLLRKLQTEAPGTYYHCMMIGALAETVAEELGMDKNLVRVGAYYHDIGKIRRPRHFIENQIGGENIHDTLTPTLSAAAIIAHVREGLELANEFHLPKKVKQFIAEHHGTTFLSYFYKKALVQEKSVEREQFCYPGPKPQSRETALLMIMDSLEAAMRAESKNISKISDIQEIIERVVNIKIAEKQLDDADFTLKELELIKSASLKALQSMYHTRNVKEIKEEKGS